MAISSVERLTVLQNIHRLESVRDLFYNSVSPDSLSVLDDALNSLRSLLNGKCRDVSLSEHFKLSEFLASPTAVRHNLTLNPSDAVFQNLRSLCSCVLEPARRKIGHPIYVTSGYRSQSLNRLVGGVSDSMHLYGRAADIMVYDFSLYDLYEILKGLPHSELILHSEYIHVAL